MSPASCRLVLTTPGICSSAEVRSQEALRSPMIVKVCHVLFMFSEGTLMQHKSLDSGIKSEIALLSFPMHQADRLLSIVLILSHQHLDQTPD